MCVPQHQNVESTSGACVFKFSHALEREKFVRESCVDVLLQNCAENNEI
jgi:hypothetical protein